MANEFKFQPSTQSEEIKDKSVIKFLPDWMKESEQIQLFCEEAIQQWFNPAEQTLVDGYMGDRGSPVASGRIFLGESDTQREEYQLSTAYVSRNADKSVRSIQFYPELVNYLKHYGALSDNESRMFGSNYYSWTPPINPNKIMNFSTYVWDTKNEFGITTPDYIVMERGSIDGNPWSLQNCWYSLGQTLPDGSVLTSELSMSARFVRAKAPIIEFNKNIELMNFGKKFRGIVTYLADSVKPEDIVQRRIEDEIRVDGQIISAGDRILFTSIGNTGENNRIYKVFVDTMSDGKLVYGLVLDENEESDERPSGEPLVGDVVLIKEGNSYKNKSFFWDGFKWNEAQTKGGINYFPKFCLYDANGIILNDDKVYPSSTFEGSELFGFKINYNFREDPIYNRQIELSEYNYYVFENFLQSKVYSYKKSGLDTNITGLYYYKVQNETSYNLKSDWVRKEHQSKQFVRQVPTMVKESMYRVFQTLSDLNNFTEPKIDMYAYVAEEDLNYRYFVRPNANFPSWNMISTDAYQYDTFKHTFEIAQKIDLSNKNESIEVSVNGDKLHEDSLTYNEVNGVLDSVTIKDDIKLDENSIVTIRTYSPTKSYDKKLGAYEIPINMKNNPYNESIDFVHQGEYTLHFNEIIRSNITRGSVNDDNDYEIRLEQSLVDNSTGTQIIQNESSLLPLMTHTSNTDLNIFESIMFMQAEYFRFKNKFNSKMIEMYTDNSERFLSTPASALVDEILSSINSGKNETFPFALSNMGSVLGSLRSYIPATPQYLGILQTYRPQKSTPLYIGKQMIRYNIDHCGIATKSYLYVNGAGYLDEVLYELENRIYQSIDVKFKDTEFVPMLNESNLNSSAYYDAEYTNDEYNQLLLRGYINFIATNTIDSSIHKYDSNNWMTWNFKGTNYIVNGQRTNKPARGSWRAIYTDVYGTYRPYSHPWEMFGFSERPEWFNLQYKPTKVRLSNDIEDFLYVYEAYVINENGDMVPSGLWNTDVQVGDAQLGIIRGGSLRGEYDKFKRFGEQPFTINKTGKKTSDGEEICEIILRSPMEGMIYGALNYREEPWAIGDMGDMEFTYMNTPMFAYDRAMALLRAKPAQFMTYFYDTRNSNMHEVLNGLPQFLYSETKERLNFGSSTLVHTENNGRILGYQTWVSDFLINQNKNITTKYGDILRSSYINVGHRIGAYTKADQLTFSSNSFGLISQENQYIGLSKSLSVQEQVLSSLKITWNGSTYSIQGYDLVKSTLPYYEPLKTSKRKTININNRNIVHYNQYNTKKVLYLDYGTSFTSIQEVYQFICSYGAYLKEQGWIFEELTNDNDVNDWDRSARSYVAWATSGVAKKGDFISISPVPKTIKFGVDFGSVESVTQYSGGVWTLLDDEHNGIRPDEIETVRLGNVFTVRLNEDVDKRIALIRLNVVSYEHAVVFDDKTIFGDNIYIPKFGSVIELIKMYGYVTSKWRGRLQAPGFMILESGTLPNFDKLVNDFTDYYNNDKPTDNQNIKDLSRHLIGFQTRDFIRSMISDESAQVDFYKGYIREKGTKQSLEKVLRVSKTYNTQNYKALEEWAFKLGTYGNVNGQKNLQFKLSNTDFNQEPQLFVFDKNKTADFSGESNVITYYGEQGDDERWIKRPTSEYNFPSYVDGKSIDIKLPYIGPVTLDEVDFSTKSFETVLKDRKIFTITYNKQPKSVWMFRNYNDTWAIYDIVDTGVKLKEILPIDSETQYNGRSCTVKLNKNHNLVDDDVYFFADSTNYMPDLLRNEKRFFNTGSNNEIVVSLDIQHKITFEEGSEPTMYKYVPRYKTQKEINNYEIKKSSYKISESTYFERASTYNSVTNMPETYLNVYDPIHGIISDSIKSEITYASPIDPAQYNSVGGKIDAWGSEQVGKVWWDTSDAFYLDYTRPVLNADNTVDELKTLEYRRTNWGKLLPNSSIDIYEWVKSPVEPVEWEKYCNKQAKLNKDEKSWIPSGEAVEDNYSTFFEYDETTDGNIRYFYFWVKNPIYIPKTKHRSKSVNEITRCIMDPKVLNVPWYAPVYPNAFIISGLSSDISDDKSVLSLSYQRDKTEIVKHEQYQLCKEGLDYNFNSNVWDTLFNSLKGEEIVNGKSNTVLYPSSELGCEPTKTWFKNIKEARRTFVDSANLIYKSINITTNPSLMDDVFNIKTSEKNPNLVDVKVLNYNNELMLMPSIDVFKENDPVLISSNGTLPKPFNSNDVYFVHIEKSGYIQLMRAPSADGNSASIITIEDKGEGHLTMIKQSDYIESLSTSLDMTQYWEYTDWYDVGYNENTSFIQEISLETADQKNYQEGDIIKVTGSDNIWTLYVKVYTRTVPIWRAIGRQNSTVKLNNRLYQEHDLFNTDGSVTPIEGNIRQVLTLLKKSFDNVQSRLVFDMVKYAHTEQTIVDWVFKTSFIYVIGLEQSLQRSYIEQDDLINQIVTYFEEVKPYRTKIRSQIEQKTSDEDEVNGVANDLDPNAYINVNGKWVKTESDIWDYEYAELDPFSQQWIKKGELPSDFVSPNRRFQEASITLQFDNVQCDPSLSDSDTIMGLEALNAKYKTLNNDLLLNNEQYKLQRASYSTPEYDYENQDISIATSIRQRYPFIKSTTVNEMMVEVFTSFKNDIDKTNEFIKFVQETEKDYWDKSSQYKEVLDYTKYNTYVNRLSLYQGMDDESASIAVGCPFGGKQITDNPNTRLPFGFSSSTDSNIGYLHWGKRVNEHLEKLIVEKYGTILTMESMNDHLIHEFGVYRWADEFKVHHDSDENENIMTREGDDDIEEEKVIPKRIIDDLHVVLSLMLDVTKEEVDHYEYIESLLYEWMDYDSDAVITLPRKFVVAKIQGTDTVVNIPMDRSLLQYAEEHYISTGKNITYEFKEGVLDDLPLDKESPLYSDYKEIIQGANDRKFFNDMNSFDNLALESQTNNVIVQSRNDINKNDSPFINIAELNPNDRDVSQMRSTITGYNYDHIDHIPIKEGGNFQIEGYVILNPYNKGEVLISIPRYEQAMEHMNKNAVSAKTIRYSYNIRSLLGGNKIELVSHDFKVGENIAIFTPEGDDYIVEMTDGSYHEVLKTDAIKTGNRPTLFKILKVEGNILTLDGFNANRFTALNPNMVAYNHYLAMNAVRITTFADPEFVRKDGHKLYSSYRAYGVDVLDYDVFYDRWFFGSYYDEALDVDDYDAWMISNEIFEDEDGNIFDNGYILPIYGKGAISDLVRNKPTENLQIFVYEYDPKVINPNKKPRGKIWNYTMSSDVPCKLSVMYTSSDNRNTIISYPKGIKTYTYKDAKIISDNITPTEIISTEKGAMMSCITGIHVLEGIHSSVELYHEAGKEYEHLGVALGKDFDLVRIEFTSDVNFNKGLTIDSETTDKLLKQ